MRLSTIASVLFISVAFASATMAQTAADLESSLRTTDETARRAIMEADLAVIQRVYHPAFVFNAPGGRVLNREQLLTTARAMGQQYGAQPLNRRFSNIYLREDGEWRLIVRHANVVPRP